MVVASVKGIANQVRPPIMNPHTPYNIGQSNNYRNIWVKYTSDQIQFHEILKFFFFIPTKIALDNALLS